MGLIKESARNVTRGVETAKGSQAAMEQIRAASQMVQVMIEDLSDSMRQQVGAVKELAGLAQELRQMTAQFKIGEELTPIRKEQKQAAAGANQPS